MARDSLAPCAESWATSVPTDDGVALDVVLDGLRRLEYRGYDSAGVAVLTDDGLVTAKRAGKLVNLRMPWSTTPSPRPARASATPAGPPTAARPTRTPTRTSATAAVAVIHNGIIENFARSRPS